MIEQQREGSWGFSLVIAVLILSCSVSSGVDELRSLRTEVYGLRQAVLGCHGAH